MSTHKSNYGGNSSESAFGSYSFVHDHKPCKGDSSSPDLVHDANWWFHHGLGRGFSHNQLNVLDVDAKLIEEYYTTYSKNDAAFCSDLPLEHFCSPCKSKGDSWSQEFKSTVNDDVVGLDAYNFPLFERPKKLYSELDSNWIGLKKIEPWWHAVNKDDLTPLVSQISSHHIRDQDPGVQSVHVGKETNVVDSRETLSSMVHEVTSSVDDCTQGNPASVRMDRSLGNKRGSLLERKLQDSDGTSRSRCSESFITPKVEPSDIKEPSDDVSRSKLLEALCHSQTKAREAEKLAQKACDEKDDVINLFFRQASCLFAYRQWVRILQLETLCLHLRSKEYSFTPPILLPRVRSKGTALRKISRRAAKKQTGKPRCNHISRCAIAFALGLSLAGAGLLVGWTIGCSGCSCKIV
ncbi:hypothetical protein ABFX02_06G100500 [Erythranthe guttata]